MWVVAMISQPAGTIRRWLAICVFAFLASACSSQPPVTQRADPIGKRAAAIALDQLGTPYRYGGNAPSGFDCSGLVHYSYARAGKFVPRTTTALWNHAEPIDGPDMQAGDLLFFNISGKMSHVGLYLGDDRFIHAPSSGKVVSIESLRSDYYRRAFIRAGRPR